jgi:hypothetical protein
MDIVVAMQPVRHDNVLRFCELWVMSPTSYQTAPPRVVGRKGAGDHGRLSRGQIAVRVQYNSGCNVLAFTRKVDGDLIVEKMPDAPYLLTPAIVFLRYVKVYPRAVRSLLLALPTLRKTNYNHLYGFRRWRSKPRGDGQGEDQRG